MPRFWTFLGDYYYYFELTSSLSIMSPVELKHAVPSGESITTDADGATRKLRTDKAKGRNFMLTDDFVGDPLTWLTILQDFPPRISEMLGPSLSFYNYNRHCWASFSNCLRKTDKDGPKISKNGNSPPGSRIIRCYSTLWSAVLVQIRTIRGA